MTGKALKQTSDGALGPKMSALSERQQKFVIALFIVKQGHGAAVRAARSAGYGTSASNNQTMASISSRLMHDERILEAVREYGERFLKAAGPSALRALEKLILTPSHKDHGRAVAAVVDRLYPTETVHNVKVEHDVTPSFKDTAEVMERIAALAARYNAKPAGEMKTIDAEPNP
jgi:phage terminase small subunit